MLLHSAEYRPCLLGIILNEEEMYNVWKLRQSLLRDDTWCLISLILTFVDLFLKDEKRYEKQTKLEDQKREKRKKVKRGKDKILI